MWSSHTRTLSSLFAGSTFGDVKQDELELRIDNAQRSLDRLTAQIPGATAAVANGKYAEWAEAQEATANKFRTMAICLFVTAVLFTFVSALWGMLSSTDESVNWLALGSKFAAGAGLTALGGYLAREGTKHRRDGLAAREIELAIATIEGYFQDDESRTIMREAYARGVFVQSTQSRIRLRDNAKASDDTGDMLATLDTALGVAQKARAMGG
ncbi:hypothetical protein SAMN04487781_3211 [Cellulosimicrobium cellulans]|nr:hypothetical protein SAMN04487781_3211 [Cellulosimicrobium cellulans]